MPSYNREVQVPGKSSQELYEKVASDIGKFLEKTGTGSYDVKQDPAKKQVTIKGSMFSATLACTDGKISLDGNLSLLASPFRSKIDQGIDRWVEKTFRKA